jgi:hypothetical protein
MSKFNSLKKGSILSELSFYTVESISNNEANLVDSLGNKITIGKQYVEDILSSADYFDSEITNVNVTTLAKKLINSPRVAMTVGFYKKDKKKTKAALNKEIADKSLEFADASLLEVSLLIEDLIKNPITEYIPGDFRIMKGRHEGKMNDLGRLEFYDMEDGGRPKQVDPRTIEYIIVEGVKYSKKK